MIKTSKYGFDIKLAEGINITNIPSITRESAELGISTGKYGKLWFDLPEGKAIFKTYDSRFLSSAKRIRIINEIICCKLLNQVGIPCAKYEPATFDEKEVSVRGLVTYDIKKDKERLIHLYELSYEGCSDYWTLFDIYNHLDELSDTYKLDKEEICLGLYEMMVFDLITMQTDRNTHNIHFIANKETKTFRLAPILDNELAFCGKRINEIIESEDSIKYSIMKEMNNPFNCKYGREVYLYRFNKEEDSELSYNESIKKVVSLANSYDSAKESLSRILSNINIDDAIRETEEMGFNIGEDYKNYLRQVVNSSFEIFEKYIFSSDYTTENEINF